MAVIKRVLWPQRLRRVPRQFSWVDHRLVRDKYICGRSTAALALYLFLITVADAEGLSYYSDDSISKLLPLDGAGLSRAREELIAAQLIAYEKPLYQVLALGEESARMRRPVTSGEPESLGQILSNMMRRNEP